MKVITHNGKIVIAPNGKALVGGGVSLNIAYGLTAPEDTSKIWVKTSADPSKVIISNEIVNIQRAGSLPKNVYGASVCAVGDDIYVIGGYNGSSNSDLIFKYNTVTEESETIRTHLPYSLFYPACCAVGDYIYIFGGSNRRNIYRFNTLDSSLTTMSAVLPVDAQVFEAAQINGKCYIFLNKKIYKYDPSNDTLTTLIASQPYSNYMRLGCVGSKIYIFGYVSGTTTNVYVFDANTDTCTDTGILLENDVRTNSTVVAIGNKCYMLGSAETYVFDSTTGEIYRSKVKLDTIYYSCCVAVREKIYIFGGQTSITMPASVVSAVYRFTESSVDDNHLLIVPDGGLQKHSAVQNIIDTNYITMNAQIADSYIGTEDGINKHVEVYQYINSEWTKVA